MKLNASQLEQAIIGALLTSPVTYRLIAENFRPSFIDNQLARKTYSALEQLIKEGKDPDPLLVAEKTKQELFDVIVYFEQCRELCLSSTHIEEYARQVKELAVKRQIKKLISSVSESLDHRSSLEAENELLGKVQELLKWQTNDFNESASSSMNLWIQKIAEEKDKQSEGKGATMYYEIEELDKALNGILPSQYIVIAAEQAGGKSMVGLNIGLRVARQKKRVKIYSTEMDRNDVMPRLAAILTGQKVNSFTPSKLTHALLEHSDSEAEKIQEIELYFSYQNNLTIEDIERDLMVASVTKKYDLIIVDYIQRMDHSNKKLKKIEAVSDNSARLRQLTLKYETTIIGLAQINREGKKNKDSPPEVFHIADSSAMEKDATQIILLWRDPNDPLCEDGKKIKFLIRKNRMERSGVDVDVLCDFSTMTLYNSLFT